VISAAEAVETNAKLISIANVRTSANTFFNVVPSLQ
jgi:hypothetical protein